MNWRRSVEFSLEKHEDELFQSVCSNKKILVLLPSVWIRGKKGRGDFAIKREELLPIKCYSV